MLQQALAERLLPPLLIMNDRQPCTRDSWPKRRQELLRRLETHIYGVTPPAPDDVESQLLRQDDHDLADKAITRQILLRFATPRGGFSFPYHLFLPKSDRPSPLIVHITFRPSIPDRYMPVEEIIDNGFALAFFNYQDVSPDLHNGDFSQGLGACYLDAAARPDNAWGRIGQWAFAASRVLDDLLTMPEIDHSRVSVAGHSRLGKTALWCAAQDERFSSVIANNSGFAGAALASRGHGEKVSDFIRCGSSDWFCPRFTSYLGRENELPFDQHDVLALIAPRRICVGSAALDVGADPPSEFLSCLAASDVYRLLGRSGLITPDRFPEPGTVLHEGEIGYHIRPGSHYFSRTDWLAYLSYLRHHEHKN